MSSEEELIVEDVTNEVNYFITNRLITIIIFAFI